MHVKVNTVIRKEKSSILFFHSFYAKRFYKKKTISTAQFLKLVTFHWVKEMGHKVMEITIQ